MAQVTRKTGAHISMTGLEIIMTTEKMKFNLVENVSSTNDVLSLRISPTLELAAAVWTDKVEESIETTRSNSLLYVLGRLEGCFPDWKFWLLAAHETVQLDNRITRHLALWKSLKARGASLPLGKFTNECSVVEEGGMRVFSAVQFELNELVRVYSVMQITQAAIAFMETEVADTKLSQITAQGWAVRNTKPPEEIVKLVCDQSGLVIDIFGEFDDFDVSVAAFGRKELLSKLNPG